MLIPDIKSYVVNVGRGKNKDDLYYAKMAAEWLDIELEEVHVSKTQINQKQNHTNCYNERSGNTHFAFKAYFT